MRSPFVADNEWERNIFKPPDDPIKRSKATGCQQRNAATGFTLFQQSLMPFGQHAGKIMQNVPASYYLWLKEQPWASAFKWRHVLDYIDRHLHEIEQKASSPTANHGNPPQTTANSLPDFQRLNTIPWIERCLVSKTLRCTSCQGTWPYRRDGDWPHWLHLHARECEPKEKTENP